MRNFEILRKQRLFRYARQSGGNFFLLLRRRCTYIQHVHFYLRLRRLRFGGLLRQKRKRGQKSGQKESYSDHAKNSKR